MNGNLRVHHCQPITKRDHDNSHLIGPVRVVLQSNHSDSIVRLFIKHRKPHSYSCLCNSITVWFDIQQTGNEMKNVLIIDMSSFQFWCNYLMYHPFSSVIILVCHNNHHNKDQTLLSSCIQFILIIPPIINKNTSERRIEMEKWRTCCIIGTVLVITIKCMMHHTKVPRVLCD